MDRRAFHSDAGDDDDQSCTSRLSSLSLVTVAAAFGSLHALATNRMERDSTASGNHMSRYSPKPVLHCATESFSSSSFQKKRKKKPIHVH